MSQSRSMSLVESITNTVLGIVLAVFTQILVFPWFGLHATIKTNISLALVFTAISLVRSYLVRRFFNSLGS